jgi:hypothetical protein
MEELRKEAYGPAGDALRHLPFVDLAAGLRALADAPKDVGVLALVVRRLADGARETPARLRLTPEEGVPGDGWSRRPPRSPDAQLAVMRHDVAVLIANGQPLTLFGDNLFVELDISTANLPCGARPPRRRCDRRGHAEAPQRLLEVRRALRCGRAPFRRAGARAAAESAWRLLEGRGGG